MTVTPLKPNRKQYGCVTGNHSPSYFEYPRKFQ